jgi:hypothetical protein
MFLGQPEIDHLQRRQKILRLKEEIFGLEITMNNVVLVKIVDCSHHLNKNLSAFQLIEIADLKNFVKDISTSADSFMILMIKIYSMTI